MSLRRPIRREAVRRFLTRFSGQGLEVALEATTGVWVGAAPQLSVGIVVFRVETRPSPEEVGRWGALAHLRGVRGLAELLCGEGALICRETIERSML